MVRIVEHAGTGPYIVDKQSVEGGHLHICGCGLTLSAPFCDGSHRLARREDPSMRVRYVTRDGERIPEPVVVRRAEEVTRQETP